jgi:hypothetical protein
MLAATLPQPKVILRAVCVESSRIRENSDAFHGIAPNSHESGYRIAPNSHESGYEETSQLPQPKVRSTTFQAVTALSRSAKDFR